MAARASLPTLRRPASANKSMADLRVAKSEEHADHVVTMEKDETHSPNPHLPRSRFPLFLLSDAIRGGVFGVVHEPIEEHRIGPSGSKRSGLCCTRCSGWCNAVAENLEWSRPTERRATGVRSSSFWRLKKKSQRENLLKYQMFSARVQQPHDHQPSSFLTMKLVKYHLTSHYFVVLTCGKLSLLSAPTRSSCRLSLESSDFHDQRGGPGKRLRSVLGA